MRSSLRHALFFAPIFLIPFIWPAASWALPARSCDAQRLGPIDFELCEAKRLDEAAAALRARAAGADVLARQRNPNCDDDDGPVKPTCDAASIQSGPVGVVRAQATALEAEADAHRANAEVLRRGGRPAVK